MTTQLLASHELALQFGVLVASVLFFWVVATLFRRSPLFDRCVTIGLLFCVPILCMVEVCLFFLPPQMVHGVAEQGQSASTDFLAFLRSNWRQILILFVITLFIIKVATTDDIFHPFSGTGTGPPTRRPDSVDLVDSKQDCHSEPINTECKGDGLEQVFTDAGPIHPKKMD